MNFIRENKGLLIFYLAMSLVVMFWVAKVERESDRIMHEKNAYVLTNYR